MRADLAAADEVLLWAMSSRDIVPPLLLRPCSGAWPDPLRSCFEGATANIPAQTDELFGIIAGLAREGVIVLAGDAYARRPMPRRTAWATSAGSWREADPSEVRWCALRRAGSRQSGAAAYS